MAKAYKVTIAGEEYDLRFTRKERRVFERRTKKGLRDAVFSGLAEDADALVWAAIQDDNMSYDELQSLIDAEEEQNGAEGIVRVWNVARRAVLESEMAGKFTQKQIDKLIPPEHPAAGGPAAAVLPQ